MLSQYSGNIINNADIARTPGVSEPTVRDCGLLHRLLRIPDAPMLRTHPVVGKSWEGMVVKTLLRGFENAGLDVQPFDYRTRGGAEVGLILQGRFGPGTLLPIEIKLTQQGDKRALSEFVSTHECPSGLVINNDERQRWLDERILSIQAASL